MEKRTRMWVSLAVILALAAAAGVWGFLSWRHNEVFVATDDAYVKGPVVSVASRVPGAILTLGVKENDAVKAGQVLATL
ncbi:MAG: biotin/lipoyl-binding protein, partial [Holophaga sp.]|nr:biotin/lipoyl-binding protein [Holophaga sp.]